MKNNMNIAKRILLPVVILLVLAGCDRTEDLGNPDRLFRPIFKEPVVSMTWIKAEWDKYKGTNSYEVELSTDTFKNILRSNRTDSALITFNNLEFDTPYQIRVRGVGDSILSSGDTIRSEYNILHTRTQDYPTQLITPASADVIDKSIRVKWTVTSLVYSHIDVMLDKNTVYKTIPITEADNLAGEKIISGLQPSTSYIVKIYSEDGYKGKKTFKTVDSQVFEGPVVDLRDFSDEEAFSKITQAFIDSLGTAYPEGFNLVLSGGTRYKLPTINIPVSMNMVTGLSFKGKAIVAVNGNFGIKAATNVGAVKIEKVFFTEGTDAGKLRTDGNFGGTYLFNFNQAEGNLGSLTIENCDIKYKRGVVRLQTTAKIDLLTINNTLADSIGGYGIVNLDNANSMVTDLVIKNSTFSHFDGYLCRNIKPLHLQIPFTWKI